MGFLSVIRRWALRDKMPIREIARRTGLSRNTIKKYLREDAVEPRFKTPSRPSKLDPYADRLSAWLLAQTRKSRKERRNVKLMHEDLVKLGYDGSYERVAAFARAWRADRHRAEQTTGRGTFVPLVFQPGEAFQFDWSEDWATIGGERVKLQVAHTKLSHSRAFLVRAYPLQTHEMLFDAHWHRKPGKVIYDWRHYLAVIQRKPGALRNGAPFTEMPDIFRRLQDHMLRKEGGDREMVDILSLVLHHDESAVLRAVELALESGVPTKTHILNLLHRLIDPKQTDHPEIDPPDALALETAPKANVDRYDDLRQAGGKRNAS